jgi:hypothetical protein
VWLFATILMKLVYGCMGGTRKKEEEIGTEDH